MNLVDLLTPFKNLLQPSDAAPAALVALPNPATDPVDALPLAHASIGQSCLVAAVHPPEAAPEWARWLAEIGFIPGEPASVQARSPWGDGALVVRIGTSTFALRREEAACISVIPQSAATR